jgi:hypothetical protein
MKRYHYFLIAFLFTFLSAVSSYLWISLLGPVIYPFSALPLLITTLFFLLSYNILFNSIFRKRYSLKNYFTSPFNLFTAKDRRKRSYDISKDLLYENVVEVLNMSGFRIVEVNEEKNEIFAFTRMSVTSWGENIYIDLATENKKTILNLCSVTVFGLTSWGRNEKNCRILLEEIERVFIV